MTPLFVALMLCATAGTVLAADTEDSAPLCLDGAFLDCSRSALAYQDCDLSASLEKSPAQMVRECIP
ncbi:MAG TPA: hypothetical protein VNZ52_07115 [Candidatus Thermoplasmatota archaeon]|nr:hypothetical protein [Candidatus Thermoplasmatota archaeon]